MVLGPNTTKLNLFPEFHAYTNNNCEGQKFVKKKQ